MNTKISKITTLAMLLAAALILSYIESILSLSMILPGIKLGLSNIAVVLVLYMFGDMTAFLFGVIKCLLSLLFLGRLSSLFFSLTGILLALLIMIILKRTKLFSLFGVCVSGSVFHIWGQLAAICIFYSGVTPLKLAPLLTICAVVSGAVVFLPVKAVLHFYKPNHNL